MVRAQLDDIPGGNEGLRVKLQRLRALVNQARADASFVQLARNVVRDVPERDYAGERAAVSRFVRRMRYTRDPAGVELFTDPRILAQQLANGAPAFGDCDDATGLACALLEALGHPTRFAVGGEGRGNWSHIWAEVYDAKSGRWVAHDDTAKHRPPGWSPASHFATIGREQTQGTPMQQTRLNLPTDVLMASLPLQLGGLGKLKVKKMRKLFVKSINPAVHLKKIGKAKITRKALPVAAVVANVVPGGTAVSAGLMVANAAVQRQRQAERMRAARQSAAAQEEADAAAFQAQQAEQQTDQAAALMQQQAVQMQRFDAPDLAPAVVDDGAARAWIDQAMPEEPALGDWSGVVNAVAQYGPQLIDAAGSGAFGSKAARLAGRLKPAASAAASLMASNRNVGAPTLLPTTTRQLQPAPQDPVWRDVPQRQATPQERGEAVRPQPRASLAAQHPYAFAAGAAALLFVVSRFVR